MSLLLSSLSSALELRPPRACHSRLQRSATAIAWLVTAAATLALALALAFSPAAARAADAPVATLGEGAAEKVRLISIGSAVTEIVYALGSQDLLVGVDTSSIYPEAATKLPQVGYERMLAAEGILSLRPTLVIAMSEAGPPAVIQQLRDANVRLVIVPANHSVEAAKEKIRIVAEALGKVEEGKKLSAHLDEAAQKSAALLTRVKSKPKVMFIYSRGGGAVNVAGSGNAADAIIRLAGGENAVTEYKGYRPLTSESAVAAAPDVLLLTKRGLESAGGAAGLLQLPGLALTPAGKSGRVVAVEDTRLLNFGPRLGEALLELIPLLHPELAAAEAKTAAVPAAQP